MITSLANERVKYVRSLSQRKQRAANREFVVEGTRIIEEAERAGLLPALVFFQPDTVAADPRARLLLERLQARTQNVYSVSPSVMHSMAQTETPQGLLAVYPFPELPRPDSPDLLLVLDTIRDPGNLGTILRTAWAAAVDQVLLTPGTADPFNPKVVRSGMGAHFSLPISYHSWPEIRLALSRIPRVYLADAHGQVDYARADWSPPRALIVGGEAEGASAEAAEAATARISIPMPGRAESLNAAVAAGVLLFRAIRDQSAS